MVEVDSQLVLRSAPCPEAAAGKLLDSALALLLGLEHLLGFEDSSEFEEFLSVEQSPDLEVVSHDFLMWHYETPRE